MASVLKPVKFNHTAFRSELAEFEALLASKPSLSETGDILPFFKSHEHLTAYIGALYLNIPVATEMCYEFDIQGAFRADVLLGSRKDNKFCIVEFEPGE